MSESPTPNRRTPPRRAASAPGASAAEFVATASGSRDPAQAMSRVEDPPVEAPAASDRRLRIHMITEDDPLYVIRFFDVFFAEYPEDELELVGVTVLAPFRESRTATAARMFRLYGPGPFARLVVKVAGARLRRRSIATLARRARVPVLPTASVNDPEYVARVRALGPDVIVSVAAPEIFRADLLALPPLGCVNLHSGRLPRYRGMMPTFWQMLSGEPHVTVTVHEMVEALDAGGVLATEECAIREHDTLDRVMGEAKVVGARLMIRALRELARGQAASRPLGATDASYFSFPERAHARELRRLGHSLI